MNKSVVYLVRVSDDYQDRVIFVCSTFKKANEKKKIWKEEFEKITIEKMEVDEDE